MMKFKMKIESQSNVQKYAPKYISFYQYQGNDLSDEVANIDTSNITNMRSMFDYCEYLTELDLSNFDTSNVTTFYNMFNRCVRLQKLDLSSFDTSNVTSVRTIFYNCSSLQELNVTGWNISKITNVNNTTNMFYNCTSLNKLILGNVSQSTYNWWVARLTSAGIKANVTIEATIV